MNGTCSLPPFGNDGRACTLIAVPSVTLKLKDAAGQAPPSAVVNFRVDGGPINQASCNGNCESFPLTYELTGHFEMEILALGFHRATKAVDVVLDEAGCHPVPQGLDVTLEQDTSLSILDGAWSTNTYYGEIALRFGGGKIIGAIFYSQRASGDGNYYIAYNGKSIKGAAGQPVFHETAGEPTRSGNNFTFKVVSQGVVAGFENAAMSADFKKLTGTLNASAVVYTRLSQVPPPLQSP